MNAVSGFPHISSAEFEASCRALSELYVQHRDLQSDWMSADVLRRDGSSYLRVTKLLDSANVYPDNADTTSEPDEVDDDDEVCLLLRKFQVDTYFIQGGVIN